MPPTAIAVQAPIDRAVSARVTVLRVEPEIPQRFKSGRWQCSRKRWNDDLSWYLILTAFVHLT